MRTFKIIRNNDESGISGTGHVIDGVIFASGKTVIEWLSDTSSIAIYNSFEEFKFIHIDSHPSNDTEIIFNVIKVI